MGKNCGASYNILSSDIVETKKLPYTTSTKSKQEVMNGKQLG